MVGLWALNVTHANWEGALPLVFVPWMGAAMIGRTRLIRWPCPRCGQPFFAALWYNNEWANHCVNCKLAKWN